MIRYQVRSRFLVDLVNEINNGNIILAPYFQRKLVWRLAHKVDFIKTILLGYPFPEIFISRGAIDVDKMTSTSFVVDGQQRMTSIKQYIEGKFEVDGRTYTQLDSVEKERFLKYEIAVIDLDVSNEDPRVVDIFKRLNRTFYSLTNIERISTEYASSELMLVAKLLAREIDRVSGDLDIGAENIEDDPNLTEEYIKWAKGVKIKDFHDWILEYPIFTKYEVSRQVHLMFVLNILSTIAAGYYSRNEVVTTFLERYAEVLPDKEKIVRSLNDAAGIFVRARFHKGSYWLNKANAFSLILVLYEKVAAGIPIDPRLLRTRMELFEKNLPPEYSLAAREAVNNKRERLLRKEYLIQVIDETQKEDR